MERRSPIVAVIMSVIPFVNIYLIYKWWEELKQITKATYDPIIQVVLCLIPIVNLYFIWKLLNDVEMAAKSKGMEGYPMGATVLYIVTLVLSFFVIGIIPALYMVWRTQELMNKL